MSTAERLEELRDLPLVTAQDRERYKQWEQEALAELAEVEPKHAREERTRHRVLLQRDGLVDQAPHRNTKRLEKEVFSLSEWRTYWRSLPDHDGPPMKPPSGPAFEFFDCTGTPAQEFSETTNTSFVWLRERITDAQAQAHAELLQHFAAMARRGECEFVGFGLIDATPKDAYGQPSAGGRGWCRGLAGVSK
jgi:hypothetical protein